MFYNGQLDFQPFLSVNFLRFKAKFDVSWRRLYKKYLEYRKIQNVVTHNYSFNCNHVNSIERTNRSFFFSWTKRWLRLGQDSQSYKNVYELLIVQWNFNFVSLVDVTQYFLWKSYKMTRLLRVSAHSEICNPILNFGSRIIHNFCVELNQSF